MTCSRHEMYDPSAARARVGAAATVGAGGLTVTVRLAGLVCTVSSATACRT